MPDIAARLKAEGAIAMPTTPDVFGLLIQSEIKRWKPVVSNAKFQPINSPQLSSSELTLLPHNCNALATS